MDLTARLDARLGEAVHRERAALSLPCLPALDEASAVAVSMRSEAQWLCRNAPRLCALWAAPTLVENDEDLASDEVFEQEVRALTRRLHEAQSRIDALRAVAERAGAQRGPARVDPDGGTMSAMTTQVDSSPSTSPSEIACAVLGIALSLDAQMASMAVAIHRLRSLRNSPAVRLRRPGVFLGLAASVEARALWAHRWRELVRAHSDTSSSSSSSSRLPRAPLSTAAPPLSALGRLAARVATPHVVALPKAASQLPISVHEDDTSTDHTHPRQVRRLPAVPPAASPGLSPSHHDTGHDRDDHEFDPDAWLSAQADAMVRRRTGEASMIRMIEQRALEIEELTSLGARHLAEQQEAVYEISRLADDAHESTTAAKRDLIAAAERGPWFGRAICILLSMLALLLLVLHWITP